MYKHWVTIDLHRCIIEKVLNFLLLQYVLQKKQSCGTFHRIQMVDDQREQHILFLNPNKYLKRQGPQKLSSSLGYHSFHLSKSSLLRSLTRERRSSVRATPVSGKKSLSDPSSPSRSRSHTHLIHDQLLDYVERETRKWDTNFYTYSASSRCSRWACTVPSLFRVLFSH
jgi:hypothetical protein